MSATETLGTIIKTTDEGRDAIHVAVMPVVAATTLRPGDHVGLLPDGRASVRAEKPLGVVDPFLNFFVQEGERFWLLIYPRTITGLRHVWTHPDLAAEDTDSLSLVASPASSHDKAQQSELWLRKFIETADCPSYDTVIALASTGKLDDDEYGASYKDERYLHFSGRDAHGEIPAEFWDHLEVVTGKRFGPKERPWHFSCSC